MRVMVHKNSILGLWLLLGSLQASQQDNDFVVDEGGILQATEVRQVEQLLASLYADKGFDFRFVTVNNLGGNPVNVISQAKAQELGVKGPGYKIACMIFVSGKEKKLSLQFSPALEWAVPDSEGVSIKREIINAFRSGNFAQGVIDGFLKINFLADQSNWTIDYANYEELRASPTDSQDKIVSLRASTVTKRFAKEKLGDEQFSDSYFIYLRSPDSKLVKLHFPKYSLDQIRDLIARGRGIVFGRVAASNPLDLNFLGWTEPSETSEETN